MAGTVLLLASASPVAGASLRLLATATGPAVTDGKRFAVFPVTTGSRPRVRVLDTARGRSRTVRTPASGCIQRSVGGGQLLWDCAPGGPLPGLLTPERLRRLDLRTGRTHPVPTTTATNAFSQPSGYTFFGIGSRWVAGQNVTPPNSAQPFFLDWRTGEVSLAAAGPRQVVDLDARRPVIDVCPGVTPRSIAFLTYQYSPPFGLARVPPAPLRPPLGPTLTVSLELDRCGRFAHRRLARCACTDAVLADGVVAWSDGRAVRAYLARRGRLLSWRMRGRSLLVAATAREVIVSIPRRRGWRILGARL